LTVAEIWRGVLEDQPERKGSSWSVGSPARKDRKLSLQAEFSIRRQCGAYLGENHGKRDEGWKTKECD